jgi:hypothetical protein
MDRRRPFTLKHGLVKLSVDLQTALAAETHVQEGQWSEDQLNILKLRMSEVGTRVPAVYRIEGQHLVSLETL